MGPGRDHRRIRTPEKCPSFDSRRGRFYIAPIPVAWKSRTIEQWRLDQSCLFRRGDYRNRDRNPEEFSRVRVSVKILGLGASWLLGVRRQGISITGHPGRQVSKVATVFPCSIISGSQLFTS